MPGDRYHSEAPLQSMHDMPKPGFTTISISEAML